MCLIEESIKCLETCTHAVATITGPVHAQTPKKGGAQSIKIAHIQANMKGCIRIKVLHDSYSCGSQRGLHVHPPAYTGLIIMVPL